MPGSNLLFADHGDDNDDAAGELAAPVISDALGRMAQFVVVDAYGSPDFIENSLFRDSRSLRDNSFANLRSEPRACKVAYNDSSCVNR